MMTTVWEAIRYVRQWNTGIETDWGWKKIKLNRNDNNDDNETHFCDNEDMMERTAIGNFRGNSLTQFDTITFWK